jgi:hypothetical protein
MAVAVADPGRGLLFVGLVAVIVAALRGSEQSRLVRWYGADGLQGLSAPLLFN